MEGHRPPFGQLLERRPCPTQTVQVDVVTGVRGEVEGTPALVRIPRHLDLERPQAATEMPLDVQTVGAGVRARPGRVARASDDDQYPHRDEKTSAHHGGLPLRSQRPRPRIRAIAWQGFKGCLARSREDRGPPITVGDARARDPQFTSPAPDRVEWAALVRAARLLHTCPTAYSLLR